MTSQVNGTKNGCIMKNFNKIFFAAVAAAFGLASCSQELTPVEKPQGNLVTVNFGAESSITCPTKATLTTEDEKLFTSAWENGDALSVKYSNDNKTAGATTSGVVSATWTTDHFEAKMPEYHGMWDYNVVYPEPDAEGVVDFGSARTQKGNAYNSKYDLMKGSAIAEGADAGKTVDGKNIVFNMTRQTAVAYFHLKSALDEEVVSAKLSVTDGKIASSSVKLSSHTTGFDLSTKDLDEITITFDEGTAPKASDYQLWFNVLPTKYTKMTLAVETTGHTMTISRNTPEIDEYVAGNLYKVVKAIPAEKWVSKAAYTGGDLVFDFKTVQPKGWPTTSTTASEGTYKYAINGVDYSFIHGTGIYCAGTTPTSAYLMIAKSSSLGLPAIMGYRLVKVVGTLNDTGSPSTKAQISITNGTDVVSGGTAQTWNTKGADYTYTLTETEENTIYYLSVSSTANCQMIKLVLSYEPATPKTALETPANLAVSAAKVVSWDAVSGAASYELTIGKDIFTSETNSYDATAVVDDYYDVAVVAIPSDKENYKNSAAATLGGAKFGTPTLATPTLKEGVVDGASISVIWTVDERATAGYNCELFKGEVKVGEGQIVNAGTVTFTGLDAETAYVVKVNAVAVEGTKAYAASPVATLEVTTKAATATANDGSLERPYTAAEAIAAIDANTGLTGKYVKGIVKAAPSFDARYNSLTYDIESGAKTLNIYSGKDLGNAGFVGAEDLKAGDEVVVFGNLKKYNKVYELDKNNYLISINGETQIYRGLAVSAPKTAFTVGDAFEFGGKALQVWRGKADVDVTASATFSGYNMSTEGKQTVTVTVGEETVTYEINVRAAGAETPKTYTLQFGKEFSDAKVTGYTSTWEATRDGFTWTMVNWNNNNAYVGTDPKKPTNWTYVRAGSRKAASVATITTKTTMPEAISTVTMTIDNITATNVNSIKLDVLSADEKTVKETINGTTTKGDCVFKITNPQQDCKYKITVDCKKGSSNGFVQVSKVVYTNN